MQIGGADAVVWGVEWNFATVRWVERHIHVVHAFEAFVELLVKLDDDFVGIFHPSRSIAKSGAKNHLAVVGNLCGFDDGAVHFAECAVAEFLSQLREVKVEIVHLVVVDVLAQFRCVLVRSAAVKCLSA